MKKIVRLFSVLLIASLLLSAIPAASAQTDYPAGVSLLDDFNRANGALGRDWTGNKSKYRVLNDQLFVRSNDANSDIYWKEPFGADQEAFVTFAKVSNKATEQNLLLKAQSNKTWGDGVIEVLYDAKMQAVQVWTWEWPKGWIKYGDDIPATFSDGDVFGARALANDLGTGIHIHLNESLSEVEISKEMFGRRPTEVAYDTGILGPDCIAAHCVWLSDAEIALMRETRTHISHNPSSNAKLGNGVARLPELLAAGLNVGLGHDAAECNNSRDMFEVMKFASLMHRATRVDASLGQAPDILRMACRNGNVGLGIDAGELAAGKKADMIVVDTRSQMFTPLMPESKDHLYSHLVFAANGSCVETTIVDGRVIYENREFTTIDEGEVLREANRAFREVIARMDVPDLESVRRS